MFQTYDKDKIDNLLKFKLQLYTTMPSPARELTNLIVMYVGPTTEGEQKYINGHIYKCIEDEETAGTYIWKELDITDSSSFVHKTGDETINGTKTFNSDVVTNGSYKVDKGGSEFVEYGSNNVVNQIPEITYGDGSTTNTVNFPNKSGTVALTDDINNKLTQYEEMPMASVESKDVICQYIGPTMSAMPFYKNGRFYKCVEDESSAGSYYWEEVEIQTSVKPDYETIGMNSSGVISVKDDGLTVSKINENAISKTIPSTGAVDTKIPTEKAVSEYFNGTNYLPLTGGTMSGTIKSSSTFPLMANGYDKQFSICGGTTGTNGGTIHLFGFRHSKAGAIELWANGEGSDKHCFKINSDGSLKHDDNDVLTSASVVDNLTSTDTDKPLSANQGKILNDKIGEINAIIDVDTLPTTDINEKAIYRIQDKTAHTVKLYVRSGDYWFTVLDSTNSYLPKSGGVMTGNIEMSGKKIALLGDPTNDDDAVNKAYADKMLPLTGGTMSGAIKTSTNNIISHTADDQKIRVMGGSAYNKGAYIDLFGKDTTEVGQANIVTRKADGSVGSQTKFNSNGTIVLDSSLVANTAEPIVKRSIDTDRIQICGGTGYDNGASITMSGSTRSGNAGTMNLRTYDGANSKILAMKPDGTLIWNNMDVMRGALSCKFGANVSSMTDAYYKICTININRTYTAETYVFEALTKSNGVMTRFRVRFWADAISTTKVSLELLESVGSQIDFNFIVTYAQGGNLELWAKSKQNYTNGQITLVDYYSRTNTNLYSTLTWNPTATTASTFASLGTDYTLETRNTEQSISTSSLTITSENDFTTKIDYQKMIEHSTYYEYRLQVKLSGGTRSATQQTKAATISGFYGTEMVRFNVCPTYIEGGYENAPNAVLYGTGSSTSPELYISATSSTKPIYVTIHAIRYK